MVIPLRKQAPDEPGPDRRDPLLRSITWDDGQVTSAAARSAVSAFLTEARHSRRACLPDRVTEILQLVVSELVTNALRHAPGPCGLHLELSASGDLARISVWDTSTAPASPRERDAGRVGGHGLEIVRALSRRLAVRAHPAGKQVSAEIAVS